VLVTATTRGAVGCTHDGGMCTPEGVCAWAEGVHAIATPREAIPGLAHDGGRHAVTKCPTLGW
jgi:hypothetical protein